MAENESIGAVSVTLTGDLGPLGAALTSAQQAAGVAGHGVATAFTEGAAGVDQMSIAFARLGEIIQQESAAQSLAMQRNIAQLASLSSGHRRLGDDAGHSVTQIQAVSGALRTFEGTGGIRAAERFLTTIPGLASALQLAFPVVGAIALGEQLGRVLGKSEELKQAEDELAKSTEAADSAFDHMAHTLDKLTVQHVIQEFGEVAGKRADVVLLQQQAQRLRTQIQDETDKINQIAYAGAESLKRFIPFHSPEADIDKIKAQGQNIANLKSQLQEVEGQISAASETAGRATAAMGGAIGATQAAGRMAAIERETSATKASIETRIELGHEARQAAIQDIDDEGQRRMAEAQEAIRVAHDKETAITAAIRAELPNRIKAIEDEAAAQGAGKSKEEQARISAEAANKVAAAKGEAQAAITSLHDETLKATAAFEVAGAEVARQMREADASFTEALNKMLLQRAETAKKAPPEMVASAYNEAAETRAAEILAKGSGQAQALAIQQQKIALEQQYATTVFKTRAGEIAYQQQLAALTQQEMQLKIQGLAQDLRDAEAVAASTKGIPEYEAALVRVANLKVQIANAAQQDANAIAQAKAAAALQTPQAQFQQQLGQAFQQLPGQVGGDIGQSIAQALVGHHPGKSIGQEMAKELTETLKSTLGSIIKQGISGLFSFGLGLLGFAEGTDSAPGGMAWVGERGPELVNLPKGSQVIPNHAIKRYADGTPGWRTSYHSTAFQSATTVMNFHAHGVNNPDTFIDHVMRRLPDRLKSRYSGFSPLSA